jgi:hypothetical protein
MKNKLMLLLILALFFQSFEKISAQTLSFSTPTTTVNSGTVVTFTVLNETLSKFIGSVPINAYTYSADPTFTAGLVVCQLNTTHYFNAGQPSVPGKFLYTLTNNGSKPYTVTLTFHDLIIVYGDVPTTGPGEITYTMTVNPAPQVTYSSTAMSATFSKNDCGPGYASNPIAYSIPANIRTSVISQEDANNQALAVLNTQGQAYANANGTCTAITYVRVEYLNTKTTHTAVSGPGHVFVDKTVADVYIKFYSDAACTLPLIITNSTAVIVQRTSNAGNGDVNTNTTYTVSQGLNSYSLGNLELEYYTDRESGTVHRTTTYTALANGSIYVPKPTLY